MSVRKERLTATGRTNTPLHSARDETLTVRRAKCSPHLSGRRANTPSPPSTAVAESVTTVTEEVENRPTTALAPSAPSMPLPASHEAVTRARPHTTMACTRSASLPQDFWEVPSETWVERFREERLRHPKQVIFDSTEKLFGRPEVSKVQPLRSTLLDSTVNMMPPAKTQSELMRNIRARNLAHPSYDIDQDGTVDHEDMKAAKRMDVDGVGALKPEEVTVGKRMLAERFFRTYKGQLHLFNEAFAKKPEVENVKEMVTSHAFPSLYAKIKLREHVLVNKASDQMLSCMALKNPDPCRHNFYNNKFDSTAWNDWGQLPRKIAYSNALDHSGSRQKLMQCRRIAQRDQCAVKMEGRHNPWANFSTKRISLITDPRYAN